jgi:DNA-binding transcriptional ArsR family regulator
MSTRKLEEQEAFFKLLANKRRLAIISVLKKYDRASVGFIADKIDLSLHATSKHLQLLEVGGIVFSSEEGNFRMYHLDHQKRPYMRAIIKRI